MEKRCKKKKNCGHSHIRIFELKSINFSEIDCKSTLMNANLCCEPAVKHLGLWWKRAARQSKKWRKLCWTIQILYMLCWKVIAIQKRAFLFASIFSRNKPLHGPAVVTKLPATPTCNSQGTCHLTHKTPIKSLPVSQWGTSIQKRASTCCYIIYTHSVHGVIAVLTRPYAYKTKISSFSKTYKTAD